MRYSFDDAKAAEEHQTQYFEIFCNRGIYHDGWTAVTKHRTPWGPTSAKLPAFDDDVWELYSDQDWSQVRILAVGVCMPTRASSSTVTTGAASNTFSLSPPTCSLPTMVAMLERIQVPRSHRTTVRSATASPARSKECNSRSRTTRTTRIVWLNPKMQSGPRWDGSKPNRVPGCKYHAAPVRQKTAPRNWL